MFIYRTLSWLRSDPSFTHLCSLYTQGNHLCTFMHNVWLMPQVWKELEHRALVSPPPFPLPLSLSLSFWWECSYTIIKGDPPFIIPPPEWLSLQVIANDMFPRTFTSSVSMMTQYRGKQNLSFQHYVIGKTAWCHRKAASCWSDEWEIRRRRTCWHAEEESTFACLASWCMLLSCFWWHGELWLMGNCNMLIAQYKHDSFSLFSPHPDSRLFSRSLPSPSLLLFLPFLYFLSVFLCLDFCLHLRICVACWRGGTIHPQPCMESWFAGRSYFKNWPCNGSDHRFIVTKTGFFSMHLNMHVMCRPFSIKQHSVAFSLRPQMRSSYFNALCACS